MIAFATSAAYRDLVPSDRAAADALRARGHEVVPAVWSEPRDWSAFDAVVVRSCWDYHLRLAEFASWLDLVGPRLVNAVDLVRWNIRKTYLGELAAAGFPVVPTTFVDAGVVRADERVVVKPVVSASAHETFVLEPGESREVCDAMVQPFVEAIHDGEWSLIAIDGQYAHAMLKRAKPGDFRVQRDHGGTAVPADPPKELIALAEELVAWLPERPAFARVDLVNGPLLMELELIEPELFLDVAPESAEKLADAITRLCADRAST